jgi:hypothetical protein
MNYDNDLNLFHTKGGLMANINLHICSKYSSSLYFWIDVCDFGIIEKKTQNHVHVSCYLDGTKYHNWCHALSITWLSFVSCDQGSLALLSQYILSMSIKFIYPPMIPNDQSNLFVRLFSTLWWQAPNPFLPFCPFQISVFNDRNKLI